MESATRPSPTLRELQQAMAALILRPERLARAVLDWTAAPPRGDRRERLDVHVNSYPARAQEVIEECFPAVNHLIGHRATHELIARYLSSLAQHSYNLNDVGGALADFLCDDALAGQFPFLPDLARLEWAVARAFHAHDRAPLDPQPLAAWTEEQWEHAMFRFQASVAVVGSPWPIRELWEARETPIDQIHIDLRDRPDQVLVCRVGFGVRGESIAYLEAAALGMLLEGCSLGMVSGWLGAHGGDPASVSTWFARWMQQRLIVGCAAR